MLEIRKRPTLVDELIVLRSAMDMAAHTANHLLGLPYLEDCHKDIKERRDNLLSKIKKLDKRINKLASKKTLVVTCYECQGVIVDYELTDEEFEMASKEQYVTRDGNRLSRWGVCCFCEETYKEIYSDG